MPVRVTFCNEMKRRQLLGIRILYQVCYITQREVELKTTIFYEKEKKRTTENVNFLFSS